MVISKLTAIVDFKHRKISMEEFDSLKKFDEFLKLSEFYHDERCENKDCRNCWFVVNLRYLHVQNSVQEVESVALLQKYCKIKIENFNCIRIF